ncbi:heavy-metal-associated domain-containing protein [Natronincola ferrireducens]|uniref:Copper chaperone CopZ n=1 Tax=Natronincola ferrireducens TaxID=393762 RepID=A0A1G8WPE4_9FIRM|nr:cation transporter [Natronincola ferrireducens]SDJ80272.1 Copper chaperone CopZ [Natronincola ferrireducens]
MKKKIAIEGMSCGHCVAHVEKALKELQEVVNVQVDLPGKNAVVELKSEVGDEVLSQIIDDAGYDVVSIEDL